MKGSVASLSIISRTIFLSLCVGRMEKEFVAVKRNIPRDDLPSPCHHQKTRDEDKDESGE